MEYILTPHAKERMKERLISERLIAEALRHPTNVSYDDQGRLLMKKIYRKRGKERLLLIAGEIEESILRIITVIDTSKVRKYL